MLLRDQLEAKLRIQSVDEQGCHPFGHRDARRRPADYANVGRMWDQFSSSGINIKR